MWFGFFSICNLYTSKFIPTFIPIILFQLYILFFLYFSYEIYYIVIMRQAYKKKNYDSQTHNIIDLQYSSYLLRKLHLRGDGPCCCGCNSCCCCCCWWRWWWWCWVVDFDGVWLPELPVIPSRPLDSFSISAPKTWRADMAEGGGSLSCSQSSWVSRVVSSVSVDVPEVCCGVPPLPPEPLFRRYRFQVPRRSSPARIIRELEILAINQNFLSIGEGRIIPAIFYYILWKKGIFFFILGF